MATLDIIRTDIGSFESGPVLTVRVNDVEISYNGDHLADTAVAQVGSVFARTPEQLAQATIISDQTARVLWLFCAGAMDELFRQMDLGQMPGTLTTALLQAHTAPQRQMIADDLL